MGLARRLAALGTALALCLGLTACSRQEQTESDFAPEEAERLVIYTSHKAEVWRPIVREFEERTGITVTPYIEEIEIATPWTMCNYVNTPEGSAYGFELKDWDNMMPRMMMMGTEFPVKGLKFVGAASIRGDGYNSAIFSGDTLAKKTLAEMKAEEA